jgi:hypothetical protein
MKKVSIITSEYYHGNNFFNIDEPWINRDDCMLPNYLLKERLKEKNIDLATQDINPVSNSDLVIFIQTPDKDNPDLIQALNRQIPCFLNISELELIHLNNSKTALHKLFSKIFTYQDKLIDNEKYFKLNYSFNFPNTIDKNINKRKLCTLISCNKTLNHPLELYSKRVEAIRWFEKHHPEDFDLYGVGWDKPNYVSGPKYKRIINRSIFLRKLFSKPYPSYRGKIERKKDILSNYKFCICYENAKDIPGWITEKMFDCLTAGCVPIYWGADNVSDHIWPSCFIDKREFPDYKKLYEYITTLSESEYLNYLNNIEKYLQSHDSYEFSIDYYIETLGSAIIEELQ